MFDHPVSGIRRSLVVLVRAILVVAPAMPTFAQDSIEEIIVTAQKQMETLQDVPISITAFSENDIDNLLAQDIADIGVFAPNVEVTRGATQPRYSIRGIGTEDFGIGADPAVGVYVDGIYVGRGGASKVAFNDIQRVEILNGPQGTLFGRNAAAGAIQYITNKPVSEEQGWVRATVGNYDKRKMEGVYNLPLTKDLYWRFGALWNEREGHVDNIVNGDTFGGEDNWSLNSALAWYPTDQLEVIFRLEYDELDQGADAINSATFGPRDGDRSDFDKVANDGNTFQQRELFGSSVHVDYDMDTLIFSSITAWRQYDARYREESDGSAEIELQFDNGNDESNRAFSQEFRLTTSNEGPLNWTTGVSYFWEDAKQISSVHFSPVAIDKLINEVFHPLPVDYSNAVPGSGFDLAYSFPSAFGGFSDFDRIYLDGTAALQAAEFTETMNIDAEYNSFAVFGDATYSITENLDFTLGVRWTRDEKDFGRLTQYNEFGIGAVFADQTVIDASGNLAVDAQGDLDPFGGEAGFYRQKESWEEVTPRAVLDYRIAEDVLTYISYSEGYKAGGFNSAGEIEAEAFDPETVENWEVGFKSSWFDYTLRVNGAFYLYDYKNLQALTLVPAACLPGIADVNSFETSDVEGKGFELQTVWIPTSGLTLNFNAGTLDTEYTRRTRRIDNNGVCETIDEKGQAVTVGETSKASPEINYSLGINYALNLASGAEVNFNAAYSYEKGNDQESCKFVEENPNGTVSVYSLNTIDGVLQITGGGNGAGANARQPGTVDIPFANCNDEADSELLNIRIVYVNPEGNWELSSYMTNVNNEHGDRQSPEGFGGSLSTPFTDGSPAYTRDDPRLYGVEFKYIF